MRTLRVLTAALLALAGAAVVAVPAGATPTAPWDVVTGSQDPVYGGTPFVFDAGVSVDNTTAGQLVFTSDSSSSTAPVVTVTAPTGGFVDGQDYVSAPPPGDPVAGLAYAADGTTCGSPSWTLHVADVAVDVDSKITSFAAHYTILCGGSGLQQTSGELRYASNVPYQAVTQAQPSWDFGSQLVKRDGWRKTFTFTNRGTQTQGFSVASGSTAFVIKSTTCTASVAAGASCSVTVAPHPASTAAPVNANLTVTPTGLPALTVALRVLGSDTAPFIATAGPERVILNWGQLPLPIDHFDQQVRVYRGTSPAALALWRTVAPGYFSTADYGVRGGTTYYYQVQPVDPGRNDVGDRSPVIAARPWPKYQAGMYHALPAPVRFVQGGRVSSAHPLVLTVLGLHGVPSGHVSSVALHVTAVGPTASTNVYVYPYGTSRPAAADLAVRAQDTRTNFVLVRVGRGGRIVIATAHGSVPITVDVSGYFSAAGLSTRYGMGGAPHVYGYYDTLVDTRGWHWGALKHGWEVAAVAGFSPEATPHVSSLIVEVTAYGSTGSGTLTGFRTNGRPNKTAVLSYRPGVVTSSVAIIRAGRWYDSNTGLAYPSVSLLNQGSKPVQLVVTLLGMVDDNTLPFGQRYVPTAPVHLLGATLGSGSNRTIHPGRNANYWTNGFNTKLAATRPSRTTTVSLRGIGLGAAPAYGQLHAPARISTVSSTMASVGYGSMGVHNSAGTVRMDVWSFGRFDFYPVPTSTPSYAAVTTAPRQLARVVTLAPRMRPVF